VRIAIAVTVIVSAHQGDGLYPPAVDRIAILKELGTLANDVERVVRGSETCVWFWSRISSHLSGRSCVLCLSTEDAFAERDVSHELQQN
jgi:hypothetical protein